VINLSRPHHIQIDINHAIKQMMTVFNGSCVVSIFPEGALSILATVIDLADAAGNKLHCFRNTAILFCGRYNKMNMIAGNIIVKDFYFEALFCLEQPFQPVIPIRGKFKQVFFLMATMGDVPDMARNKNSVSSHS
jgi:hypothetical protein